MLVSYLTLFVIRSAYLERSQMSNWFQAAPEAQVFGGVRIHCLLATMRGFLHQIPGYCSQCS